MKDIKTILVTGGAGFIGSELIRHLLSSSNHRVVNVDKLTYSGNLESLESINNSKRYHFEQIDICDEIEFKRVLIEKKPDTIIHLAAESHVDRSITDPLACITSNVMGTGKILELARVDQARLVHISTDEVYGHLQLDEPAFTEDTKLAPRSPYSATKAGSDLLVQSYITTFGIDASITRCCNNYGPRQACEKLIPTVIGKLLKDEPIPIYGNGQNIREWVHVTDHAKAIIEVLHTGHTDTARIRFNSKYKERDRRLAYVTAAQQLTMAC